VTDAPLESAPAPAKRAALRRGLYAITPDALCADPARLLPAVEAALRGGAVAVQYRDKSGDARRRRGELRALVRVVADYGAVLIVNDDAALAAEIGAHGVHLGRSDGSLAAARALLGPGAIIGASCGPLLQRARDAVAAGTGYVAFGRFFASRTKPDAPQADAAVLRAARAELDVPRVAIGGITPDNGAALIRAGADLLAAVDGVFGDPVPARVEAAARAYARLFEPAD
jgi:thiamine-phosphate pyrophosphorylase